jgi:hypothetical protein
MYLICMSIIFIYDLYQGDRQNESLYDNLIFYPSFFSIVHDSPF